MFTLKHDTFLLDLSDTIQDLGRKRGMDGRTILYKSLSKQIDVLTKQAEKYILDLYIKELVSLGYNFDEKGVCQTEGTTFCITAGFNSYKTLDDNSNYNVHYSVNIHEGNVSTHFSRYSDYQEIAQNLDLVKSFIEKVLLKKKEKDQRTQNEQRNAMILSEAIKGEEWHNWDDRNPIRTSYRKTYGDSMSRPRASIEMLRASIEIECCDKTINASFDLRYKSEDPNVIILLHKEFIELVRKHTDLKIEEENK